MERSGAQAGADNVARLKAYLDRLDAAGESFPDTQRAAESQRRGDRLRIRPAGSLQEPGRQDAD